MSNENIHLAVAYYLNGVSFRKSAEQLAKTVELADSGCPASLLAIPLYFLASHAAELFLRLLY